MKCSRRNYGEFGFLVWLEKETYSLGRHSETYAKLVMKLIEAASWFCGTRQEAWIAVVNIVTN